MEEDSIRLQVLFYRTSSGHEPAREWLKSLPVEDKEVAWSRSQNGAIWVAARYATHSQARARLPERIARVIFTVEGDTIVLLHGFIKKSGKTPLQELQLARQRLSSLRGKG